MSNTEAPKPTPRQTLALLDALRARAIGLKEFSDAWFQAWQEMRAEALLQIGIEERKARGGSGDA